MLYSFPGSYVYLRHFVVHDENIMCVSKRLAQNFMFIKNVYESINFMALYLHISE